MYGNLIAECPTCKLINPDLMGSVPAELRDSHFGAMDGSPLSTFTG